MKLTTKEKNIQKRKSIWRKYGCKCAYCGKPIEYQQMQVDHIEPRWHGLTIANCEKHNLKKGSNEIENLNPSCARCNKWKSTFSIEQFRNEISQQVVRLNKYNNNYRIALDFGMVKEVEKPILFHFETYNATQHEL